MRDDTAFEVLTGAVSIPVQFTVCGHGIDSVDFFRFSSRLLIQSCRRLYVTDSVFTGEKAYGSDSWEPR